MGEEIARRGGSTLVLCRALSFARTALLLAAAMGCAKTSSSGDGGGGSGAGSGDPCTAKADAAGAPVIVRFVNERPDEIYLWTDCDVPDRPSFHLYRDGAAVTIDKPTCSGTCGQAQTDEEPYCPIVDCERGALLRIESDATYELEWRATEQVLSSMPESCYDESKTIKSDCWRQIELPEGTYVAGGGYLLHQQVQVAGAPSNVYGCPCALAADTDGVCEVDTALCSIEGSDEGLPQVTVDLPSAGLIEYVITASGS